MITLALLLAASATVPPDPTTERDLALVREILSEVEQLRGLKLKRDIAIAILPDAEFEAALRDAIPRRAGDMTKRLLEVWTALGLLPATPAAEREARANPDLLGFYDSASRRIFVRREQEGGSPAERGEALRGVIAHELEHALQDANFGLKDLGSIPDAEEWLALKALYEGDAMLAERAYQAKRAHRGVLNRIAELSELERARGDWALVRAESGAGLDHIPAIVREQLVFQYVHGFAFASDLYLVRGTHVLDDVFRNHPPRNTGQVLDAARFSNGWRPAKVQPPQAPQGTRAVRTGSLGQLAVRVLLQGCQSEPSRAVSAAGGLKGDSFTLFETADGQRGIVWRAAWEHERHASLAASLLQERMACAAAGGSPRDGIHVQGASTGFARWPGMGSVAELARSAVAGEKQVEAVAAEPYRWREDTRAAIVNGWVVAPNLGIVGTASSELELQWDRGDVDLFVITPDSSTLEAWVVPEQPTKARREAVLREVARGSPTTVPVGLPLLGELRKGVTAVLPDGRGAACTLRAVAVPICDDWKFMVVRQMGCGPRGDQALLGFMQGLRWYADGPPLACANPAENASR